VTRSEAVQYHDDCSASHSYPSVKLSVEAILAADGVRRSAIGVE